MEDLDLLRTPTKTPQSKSKLDYSPSPSRPIYSDRFIPCRSSSNFALFNISPPSGQETPKSAAYTARLRTALFGSDLGFSPSGTRANIFRFKSETRQSMDSLFPVGFNDDHSFVGVSQSPVNALRKVPRSPYKVLDAPSPRLFRSNLGDIESTNHNNN